MASKFVREIRLFFMQNEPGTKSPLLIILGWLSLLASACLSTSSAEYDLNTDFETVRDDKPLQWSFWSGDSLGYAVALDQQVKRQGRYALRIEARENSTQDWAGIASSRLPIWFKMRRALLRGYLKREATSEEGFAGLWCRVSRKDGYPRQEEHSDSQVPPTEDWTWYELQMPIDESSMELSFGGILRGTGRLWLDSLALEIDGLPYPLAAERAATSIEGIWLPQLRERIHPFAPSTLPPALLQQLPPSRLTVLWLADDGLQMPLHIARWLYEQGPFDHLLIDAPHRQSSHYAEQLRRHSPTPMALDSLMPAWVPSRELQQLLAAGIERKALAGIDLGIPDPALQRMTPHYAAHPAWARYVRLQQRLIYQIGRKLIDRQSLLQLSHLHNQLAALPAPDSLAEDWRFLQQMRGFYASNGSSRYRDSCRIANLEHFLDSPEQRGLFLLSGDPEAHDSRSLLHRLQQHFGPDLQVIGITVGRGQARRAGGQIAPLPPLGPHCHEYYFDQLGEEAFWWDAGQLRPGEPIPWLPKQMFLRSHYHLREDLPFTTLNLAQTFDHLIYLTQSPAAQSSQGFGSAESSLR